MSRDSSGAFPITTGVFIISAVLGHDTKSMAEISDWNQPLVDSAVIISVVTLMARNRNFLVVVRLFFDSSRYRILVAVMNSSLAIERKNGGGMEIVLDRFE